MTWIAAILGILGAVLVAGAPDIAKRWQPSVFMQPALERSCVYWGHWCWLAGNALWAYRGFSIEEWALATERVIFFLIALRGVRAWR